MAMIDKIKYSQYRYSYAKIYYAYILLIKRHITILV